jgi:ABC-type transport system substrate-binding protein
MKYTEACIRIFKTGLLLALCCTLFLVSACGAVPVTEQQDTNIVQYTLPPVIESPVPAQGGELKFPIPSNPVTLNPLKVKNIELYNLFSLIYEQPLRIAPDGTAEPELAETWEVDETGTKWTFHLRKGVNWQNGKGAFTSADVIYTIQLIKSYTEADSTYAQYNDIVSNYTAPDENTVEVTLSQPGNAALYFMTFPVVCKAYCESGNIDEALPLGTGPYVAAEYTKDTQMSLKANDAWWKQAPYIPTLTAVCYPNHTAELNAFSENLVDFITTSTISVDTYKKYGVTKSVDYLTQYYDCLVPNTASGFFSDINMRKMLAFALDKRAIVSQALLGHAVAADSPVAPDSHLSGGADNSYEYNIQDAFSLLEQAGWEDRDNDGIREKVDGTQITDLKIELIIPLNREDTYRRDVADNIAGQLLQCGIDVEVTQKPYNEYENSLGTGAFELALCSFYIDQNPDVSFMLASNGASNYGKFADAEFDTMLKSCATALNEDDMRSAYTAMESAFMERLPQISLYFRTNAILYNASMNIPANLRDMDVFNTIPGWYLFMKKPGT